MKNITRSDIKALATTEAAKEYRATKDKWLHATCMIEELIQLDDYSKLNHDAMDWAVEILEDELDR